MKLGLKKMGAVVLVSIALCVSCDDKETTDETASTSNTTSDGSASSSASTTDEGTTSSSASTGMLDPEAHCAQFASQRACDADATPDTFCTWMTIRRFSREGDQCSLEAEDGMCLSHDGDSTDPGCGGGPPGCDLQPFSVPTEDGVGFFWACGGSVPRASEPCVYMEPGMYDPPECLCLCEALNEESGSSTG